MSARFRSLLYIAHRGAPYALPENTIESCRYAVERLGCDALEVDVCLSRDDVPFLWHDDRPNHYYALWRESGLRGDGAYAPKPPLPGSPLRKPVSALTFEDIRHHFGYHRIVRLPYMHGTADAVHCPIPTLAEFFDWMIRTPQLKHVFLDIKLSAHEQDRADTLLDAVITALQATSEPLLRERITLLCMDEAFLRALAAAKKHRDYPIRLGYTLELPVQTLFAPESYSSVALAQELGLSVITTGRAVWHVPFFWRALRKTLRTELTRLDAWRTRDPATVPELFVWTINHAASAQELADLGVDGIMTDHLRAVRPAAHAARTSPVQPLPTTSLTASA